MLIVQSTHLKEPYVELCPWSLQITITLTMCAMLIFCNLGLKMAGMTGDGNQNLRDIVLSQAPMTTEPQQPLESLELSQP